MNEKVVCFLHCEPSDPHFSQRSTVLVSCENLLIGVHWCSLEPRWNKFVLFQKLGWAHLLNPGMTQVNLNQEAWDPLQENDDTLSRAFPLPRQMLWRHHPCYSVTLRPDETKSRWKPNKSLLKTLEIGLSAMSFNQEVRAVMQWERLWSETQIGVTLLQGQASSADGWNMSKKPLLCRKAFCTMSGREAGQSGSRKWYCKLWQRRSCVHLCDHLPADMSDSFLKMWSVILNCYAVSDFSDRRDSRVSWQQR